ncbi:diphthine--ammonia ligase [Candidatus Woesearchaeota archaeon]|nr:diphthine--ammonia ligase [Candidatus Woesearchaeota archaeon]
MRVAILYSGGKDSTFAIQYAKERSWDIRYLLSVKPTRTDCYLFHFATVEHTPMIAGMLGIPHHLISCSVADPAQEAQLVKEKVRQLERIDALLLGGTGLQATQLRSVQDALRPMGIEVFAAHAGQDHEAVVEEMLQKGYRIMITQIASDGLTKDDLGTELTKENFSEFRSRSKRFGFHIGGEGGYYDTLVIDAPFFPSAFRITGIRKNMESEHAGHAIISGCIVETAKKQEKQISSSLS